ncbi:MAG: NAD-dependent deacylase [Acidobacteria bacterium]|nr:NAD-dependent deacylase [Acidobacteriota bacterium]
MSIKRAQEVLSLARSVVVFTGAGVSAESGVPTFRGGGGTAVWRGMDAMQLSSARMVGEDLKLVWEWFEYRRDLLARCEPNLAHLAIAAWESRFPEFTLVTQNVDGLHDKAGSSAAIELHGNLWRGRCLECSSRVPLDMTPHVEIPPACRDCGGNLRPDVVLFGEYLPAESFEKARESAGRADVCLVVGTSALVYPAAEIPLVCAQRGATVIEVNPEPSGIGGSRSIMIAGRAGDVLPLL